MLRLRAGSRLGGRGDFEALIVFVPLLAFYIGLDRCLIHRSHRRTEIPTSPHMLSPVPLSQLRKLRLQEPAASPFDVLRQFRWRERWRRRQQQMDVIRRYRTPYDHYVPRLTDLPDQVTRTLCHSPPQYFVSILRAPDHVILQVEHRVRTVPVFRHSPYSRRDLAAESGPPKGGGIKPGGRS